MANLVIAEHDNASIKGATLNTITAAVACGGHVHVLVAGHNASAAAQEASQIAGVSKSSTLTRKLSRMPWQKMWPLKFWPSRPTTPTSCFQPLLAAKTYRLA